MGKATPLQLAVPEPPAATVTVAWWGEGRRRGKRAAPQTEAKEGKLNEREKDQNDRWH